MVRLRRPFPFVEPAAYVTDFFSHVAGSATISVGNLCNQHCIYCDTHRDPLLYLDWSDASQRVDRIAALGITRLMIVGGEPTIWRRLPALIAHARSSGIRDVVVTTNGLMLAYPEYLQRLLDAGMTDLQLSCDDFDPATMRALSQNDRADQLLVRAVDNLLGVRPLHFFFNAVVSPLTRPHLPDYVRRLAHLAARRGAPIPAVLSHLKPITYAHENRELLVERVDVAGPAILAAVRLGLSLGLPFIHKGLPPCQARGLEAYGWEANVIEYRVDLDTAEELPAIQSPLLAKSPRCAECCWDPHCGGVYRNYVERFGWDEFLPVAGSAMSAMPLR